MSKKKDEKKGSRAKRHMIAIVLTLIAFVVYDYVMLPAYNIQSTETWFTVCAVLFVFGLLELILNAPPPPKALKCGARLEALPL